MPKTAVMVTIEGLGTNLLGSYGGPWAQTPELDEFAAHSIVLDQFWLDSPSSGQVLQSMWTGRHSAERALGNQEALPLGSVAGMLAQHGIDSWFVSDAADKVQLASQSDFGQSIHLDVKTSSTVEQWQECHIAQWMEMGLGTWASEEDRPALLWLHGMGLTADWDAPYRMREALVDEEDPPPPTESTPPELLLDDDDLETAFGWSQAAAAQAMLLDRAWRWVDETLAALGIAEECLVVFLGTSGYALGEHGYVGLAKNTLQAERLHAPCLIRPGKHLPLTIRSSELAQPSDVWSTLLNWFDIPHSPASALAETNRASLPTKTWNPRPLSLNWLALLNGVSPHPRHAAYAYCDEGEAIRVAYWNALWLNEELSVGESQGASLYVHPEDRWQRNDVACRAVGIMEEVTGYRDRWKGWLSKPSDAMEPLPSDLLRQRP